MDFKKRKMEDSDAEAEDSITKEDAKKLIQLFSKDQLLEIVVDAAVTHDDVLDQIRRLADQDPVHRKIFVRGLGWDTSSDTLKTVFGAYGEVEEGVVIMDKSTGKSRGFGFVTFAHMDAAERALKEPSKRIDGRMTVCQLAAIGPTAHTAPAQEVALRKIYVGNVPVELGADRLLAIFSQWGEIEEGPLGFDKFTGRSRGFALIIYKSAEAAKRALQDPIKTIDGHQVYCKLAADGQKHKTTVLQHHVLLDPDSAASQSLLHFHPGLITTGIPLNQHCSHQPFHSGLTTALSPSLTSSYSQGLVQTAAGQGTQLPTSLQLGVPSSLGGHVGYSSFASQQPAYSLGASAIYGSPASSVASPPGGHYGLTAYQNPAIAVSSSQRSQTLSAMPSYYL